MPSKAKDRRASKGRSATTSSKPLGAMANVLLRKIETTKKLEC